MQLTQLLQLWDNQARLKLERSGAVVAQGLLVEYLRALGLLQATEAHALLKGAQTELELEEVIATLRYTLMQTATVQTKIYTVLLLVSPLSDLTLLNHALHC